MSLAVKGGSGGQPAVKSLLHIGNKHLPEDNSLLIIFRCLTPSERLSVVLVCKTFRRVITGATTLKLNALQNSENADNKKKAKHVLSNLRFKSMCIAAFGARQFSQMPVWEVPDDLSQSRARIIAFLDQHPRSLLFLRRSKHGNMIAMRIFDHYRNCEFLVTGGVLRNDLTVANVADANTTSTTVYFFHPRATILYPNASSCFSSNSRSFAAVVNEIPFNYAQRLFRGESCGPLFKKDNVEGPMKMHSGFFKGFSPPTSTVVLL